MSKMNKNDFLIFIYNYIENDKIYIIMKLVERHIIKKSNNYWKSLDDICFLSKNLYNSALYYIRKYKEENGKFIRYNDLEREFKLTNQHDYRTLPISSSQQSLMLVDKSLISYFKLLSKYKNDKKSLNGYPKFPKYKDKIKGRFITIFTKDQAKLKNGYIHFPKKSNLIKNHNKYNSNRLNSLTLKRNNKITDYLHKSSRFIVNYCVKNDISNIVIGYNKEWKQEINIGKRNNQNFVQIPYYKLIKLIEYKCKLDGINFIQNEESYTSKCSALDLEPLNKQENYLGKRISRGMFLSSKGIKINADLNGALNILRKVAPDKGQKVVQSQRCRGQAFWPLKTSLHKKC